jgi:hypothetical protein
VLLPSLVRVNWTWYAAEVVDDDVEDEDDEEPDEGPVLAVPDVVSVDEDPDVADPEDVVVLVPEADVVPFPEELVGFAPVELADDGGPEPDAGPVVVPGGPVDPRSLPSSAAGSPGEVAPEHPAKETARTSAARPMRSVARLIPTRRP